MKCTIKECREREVSDFDLTWPRQQEDEIRFTGDKMKCTIKECRKREVSDFDLTWPRQQEVDIRFTGDKMKCTIKECRKREVSDFDLTWPRQQEVDIRGINNRKPGEEWREHVVELQQEYYECLGDREYDLIESHEKKELMWKVGCALFGMPTEDNENHPYNIKIMREIKKFTDAIYKISEFPFVCMAILYVVGKVNSGIISVPVFKILASHEKSVYLDKDHRHYNSFEQFIRENKLPKGVFAYPKDGIYQGDCSGRVLLTFLPSPANKLGAKWNILNIAAMALSLAYPPAAPVALAIAVGKGFTAINDRMQHKQSISLADEEARRLWFSVIRGSALIRGSAHTVAGLESAGIQSASKDRIIENISRNTYAGNLLFTKGPCFIEKFVDVNKRYFGLKKDDLSSELIRQSKKLAQDKGLSTDEDIADICGFLLIYKEMRLKEMEESYEKEKRRKKELLRENFDESRFDKEFGIQDPENRKKWFQFEVDKEIEASYERLKEKYDTSINEITAINEDGHMKFSSSLKAFNEFFHSFVIDGQELCPGEFFSIIRKLVDNETKCEVVESDTGKIYFDSNIPIYVKVVENDEGRFFESVSFVKIDNLD